jgi:UDP-sulfoquinovose synthase
MKILVLGNRGYIGHSLTKLLLQRKEIVIGVDNNDREKNVGSMNSFSATGENRIEHENLTQHCFDISKDIEELEKIFIKHKPDCIVNLAHCPSAPFSMKSLESANYALKNNILGTNNLLWMIRKYTPDSQYITIGTAGEYNHYANIDIEEGYFSFTHKGRQSTECIFPRRPGSIYHTSKVGSTYLIDFLSRTWNLKTTDVMQGVVFGLYDTQTDNLTRFDSDESFGTVVNRFCMQAVLGEKLTIYGKGQHKRAFISLRDSIQALELAIYNEPKPGRTRVWNQLTTWYSMEEISDLVIECSKELGFTAEKTFIPTPRNEQTTEHYYNFINDKLVEMGYKPIRSLKEEILFTLSILKERKESLLDLKEVVIPKINWGPSGS